VNRKWAAGLSASPYSVYQDDPSCTTFGGIHHLPHNSYSAATNRLKYLSHYLVMSNWKLISSYLPIYVTAILITPDGNILNFTIPGRTTHIWWDGYIS